MLTQPSPLDDPFASLIESLQRRDDASSPKYARLAAALRSLVDVGKLKAGEKLPTEIELAARSGFSLGTVQKALQILADRGVVDRRHGHGTFIAGSDGDQRDLWYFRFMSDAGVELIPVAAKAIDRRLVRRKGPWNAFLGADQAIRIRRLVNVGGEFTVLSDFYVEGERFGALLDVPMADLNRVALRNFLNERFGAPTYHASQRLWCDRLPSEVSGLLGLGDGAFGLVSDVFARTSRDAPISMQRIYVPPGVSPLDIRG